MTKRNCFKVKMSSGNDNVDARKALYTSPSAHINESSDMTATLDNELYIEQEIDEQYEKSKKDLLEKRMKKLRQMAKQLEDDEWRYQPIEKFIGLKSSK